MATAQEHKGSCHCGAVTFTVDIDLGKPAMTCNCSICQRTGIAMQFVPESAMKQLSGEEHLKDYQWGKKHLHHVFCTTCGVRPFARGEQDGQKMFAINVRCLEGVKMEEMETKMFDGRSR